MTSYNGTSYTYDNNGNTASKTDASGTTNYTYDYENRLSNFQSPEHQAQYTYDPFGKRLSKTVDGVANYYLYDNEDIIAEYDASGSLTASYTHGQGIDEPIQGLIPQGTVLEWYYTFDGLGTVSELTDANQNIVESYKYDAFGKLETPPTTGNPYTYTGREYDSESGLYFYRARYYDAEVGRFITKDPSASIRILSSYEKPHLLIPRLKFYYNKNFYLYTNNNPINLTDPSGEITLETAIIIITILLGGKAVADCIHSFIQAVECCEEIPQPRPPECPNFEEDAKYLEKLHMWQNRCFNYCNSKYKVPQKCFGVSVSLIF